MKTWSAAVVAALFVPSVLFAGRLDGDFGIRQADAMDATNEACVEAAGDDFSVLGMAIGSASGCEVEIRYDAGSPHKASAKALKGTKTQGSVKISQSIFVAASVIIREPGPATTTCDDALEMLATNSGDVERCKASASVKGTSVDGGDDTISSGRASFSCDLGEGGASLDTDLVMENIQPPSSEQMALVAAAFEGRKDVKVASNGKVKIKMKGVSDDTSTCP